MNGAPTNKVLQRRANVALIAAFAVFLCLPAADTFLHLDRTPSPNENRMPAAFPKFHASLAGIHDWAAGSEAYFSDHFGFRKRLVRWERRWKWQFFHDTQAVNTILGKDGWLYFSDGRMVDDIRGARPFSDEELEGWRTLLTGRRDWLAQRGIRYLFVIPPDKHTVYPEHLPDWLLQSDRGQRRIDHFCAYMRAHSDVPILDLREALLGAKMLSPVYQQTDTHWNEAGAFAAYQRIIGELAALGIPVAAPGLDAFTVTRPKGPAGDLALMLGQSQLTEKQHAVFTPLPPLRTPDLRADASLPPKKWIPGTEPLVSENPSAKTKAVVFRDSFCVPLSKFLGHSFGRTVYVWQQNWDKRILETEKPDIVIDEMVERFVISRDAGDLRKMDEEPEVQIFGDR